MPTASRVTATRTPIIGRSSRARGPWAKVSSRRHSGPRSLRCPIGGAGSLFCGTSKADRRPKCRRRPGSAQNSSATCSTGRVSCFERTSAALSSNTAADHDCGGRGEASHADPAAAAAAVRRGAARADLVGSHREAVHDRDRLRRRFGGCDGCCVCRRGAVTGGALGDPGRSLEPQLDVDLGLRGVDGELVDRRPEPQRDHVRDCGHDPWIYFAFSSGTVDSVVYDTVLEETGSNELYEKWIGRIRAVESAAFVLSALAGGVLAQYTSERFTYFATVPLVGLAIIGFLRFNEPRLHKAAERVSLRSHVALTFRTMISSRAVLRVLMLAAIAGLLSQAIFEFGPLWLVALAAPAVLYGPYWAALVSTLGIGGLLISK